MPDHISQSAKCNGNVLLTKRVRTRYKQTFNYTSCLYICINLLVTAIDQLPDWCCFQCFIVCVWPIYWQFSNNIHTVMLFCFQLTFWICDVIFCVLQITCSPKWEQVKQWWFLNLLPYFSEHIWFRGLRLHTRYRHSVWYLVSDLWGIYSKQRIAITTVPMT